MAKRTRQRQLRKLAERRAQERRRRQRMRSIVVGAITVVALAGAGVAVWAFIRQPEEPPAASPPAAAVACDAEEPASAGEEKPQFDEAPELALEEGEDYRATIRTSCGDIELDLFEDETPQTVNNFVFLANEGFYDGVTFHRVIADFMIQGGDPEGTGSGGPGYQFDDEIVRDLTFEDPGLLAMANPGQPDSNGSQFFITVSPQEHLNRRHTIFGEVTDGLDVVERINGLPTDAEDRPESTVYIEEVVIRPR